PGQGVFLSLVERPADPCASDERLKQSKRRWLRLTVAMVAAFVHPHVNGQVAHHVHGPVGASSSFFASNFLASVRLNSCSRTGRPSFSNPAGHFDLNGSAAAEV